MFTVKAGIHEAVAVSAPSCSRCHRSHLCSVCHILMECMLANEWVRKLQATGVRRQPATFGDERQLGRKALHVVGLLLEEGVGYELREVGVLDAQLFESPVQVPLRTPGPVVTTKFPCQAMSSELDNAAALMTYSEDH